MAAFAYLAYHYVYYILFIVAAPHYYYLISVALISFCLQFCVNTMHHTKPATQI